MALIAIRYARAFADVVFDLKMDAVRVREELRSLAQVVQENLLLRRVLDSPSVTHEEKLKLLDALSQQAGYEKPVRNLLAVLIEHGHIRQFGAVVRQFEKEMDTRQGYVEAEVASVRELTAEEKAALEGQIAQLTGRKVRAQYSGDKSLLGGAVVKVGGTIYDGSLRGQLRLIKKQLIAG